MNAVSSTNPGLSDLLQTLTNSGSSVLSSTLSSPAVQSALESAPQGDLVELSDQALQLQVVGALFGSPTSDTSTGADSLFDFLDPSLAGTTAASSSSGLLPTDSSAVSSNNTTMLSSLFDLQG
ncbi:MAG: hypothetical protein ABSB86_01890 [Bryobacteraceae bacterium]